MGFSATRPTTAASGAATGSSAGAGVRIVGEWVEPFRLLYGEHVTAKAWNKHTSIPTDERLRLFYESVFRGLWGFAASECVTDYGE